MQTTIKLSLLGALLISGLNADNQYTLDSIDVTASQGTTLNKKDVTDSVTIITKEALEESRITTLDEALNRLGGIAMIKNGGAGQSSSMLLRGMSASRVLVLIDGVRVNNPTAIGAAAEFSQIMLYNVEQIEIIKGAQSGVWGSDASGGVINIVTSQAESGYHSGANVEYGSFDSVKTSLQASYKNEDFDILIGGLYYNVGGFSAVEPAKDTPNYGRRYNELNLEKDAYKNISLNTKLGYNITKNDRVALAIDSIDSDNEFDSGAGEASDSSIPNQKLHNRFYTLSYSHKDSLNDAKLSYALSTFDRSFELEKWGGGGVDTYNYKGSQNELKLEDKITYMEDSFVRVGASYQKFEQEDITANTTKNYSAISAFATNYNKMQFFGNLNTIITESLRYDSYDNFDDSLTGKLGLKQFFYKGYYISANVGTGYNAPTLGQLYGQWGANPDLKPEKSLTSDITLGSDRVWITGFYNQITDLIEYTSAYTQTSGTSKFRGVEIGYDDYLFNRLGIKALYTYLETQNAQGKPLLSRPKNQIDASATYYANNDFDIGVNAQYIGTRYDKDDNKGAQTGKYTVTNIVTNLKVNPYITLYGKIDNLSNIYYQTRDGYATAGRSFYLGFNAKY